MDMPVSSRWPLVAAGLLLLGSQGRLCDPAPDDLCSADEDCPEGQLCRGGACECAPVHCTIACPFGFAVDAEGCELCSCAPPPAYDYCEDRADCVCGRDRESGECAVGNWFHVDGSDAPCADFCAGLDGGLRTVCRGGACVQVRPGGTPVLPAEPLPGLVE